MAWILLYADILSAYKSPLICSSVLETKTNPLVAPDIAAVKIFPLLLTSIVDQLPLNPTGVQVPLSP